MKLLVVVDMQFDFVLGSLGTEEAKAIVPAVVAKVQEYQANGDLVIFTRDTHHENYLETFEGKNLPVVHCVKDTEGWEIIPELQDYVTVSRTIIDKPTFGSLDLAEIIRPMIESGEVDAIELCGLCTDICVISNALLLRANFYETPISVDSKCCAGVSPETHNAALATMRCCQINVVE